MNDMPRISRVEFEILSMLRSKEMYGLELVKESSILKRGTVYVTLERMTDKGYVKSREADRAPHESGLPRRVYSISALGQRAFAAAQAAAVSYLSWETSAQ
ncbi:MAG: PadR family transcriptional regulator [Mesorhizobium sp.]|uniref:PadR family transcriptional regulator n=1 Tax=Mesorhizobium sp. TaxID=1871066 RepID=UPI00121AB308|nr:PadR family transcriptional regulator [Mesorhizobium sp.]TIL87502.1 MAG: PadR family transcriptional regulator [Mesorhizobium sp.]